jgi:hypothetical protein
MGKARRKADVEIDWSEVFGQENQEPGASEEELAALAETLSAPLTPAEIAEINAGQQNPWPKKHPMYKTYKPFDPTQWALPGQPLPASYLSFLRWSNGGCYTHGDRQFGFFGTHELRPMLLAYHVPEYLPGLLGFANDGGGSTYFFDMRKAPAKGEYPILLVGDGAIIEDAIKVAPIFLKACQGTTNPHDDA